MRSDKSGSQLVDSLDNEPRGAVLEGVALVKVNMGTGLLVREVGEDVGQRKQARTVGGDVHHLSHVPVVSAKPSSQRMSIALTPPDSPLLLTILCGTGERQALKCERLSAGTGFVTPLTSIGALDLIVKSKPLSLRDQSQRRQNTLNLVISWEEPLIVQIG